jgi:hypothetical protein
MLGGNIFDFVLYCDIQRHFRKYKPKMGDRASPGHISFLHEGAHVPLRVMRQDGAVRLSNHGGSGQAWP